MDYYTVERIDKKNKKEKRIFKTCREAFCYATNFKKVNKSKVYFGGELIREFKY